MQIDETASGLIYGWNLANANGIFAYYPEWYSEHAIRLLKYELRQERDVVKIQKCYHRDNHLFLEYDQSRIKGSVDVSCS